MATYAQNLARRSQRWVYFATIEGVGHWLSSGDLTASGSDGLTRFCTAIPDYADTTLPIWRPYLQELPQLLAERADRLGGMPDLGELVLKIVDAGDYVTQLIRPGAAPITKMTAAVTNSGTSIGVEDMTNIDLDDVVYIGGEAVRVTNTFASNFTCERGYLRTDATEHGALHVYRYIPFLHGRRVRLYAVPADAADYTEETLVGEYALDGLSWSDDQNVWILKAKSQLKYLDRLAPIKQRAIRLTVPSRRWWDYETIGDTPVEGRVWQGALAGEGVYLRNEAEILVGALEYGRLRIVRRRVFGTPEVELEPDSILQQVFVAETFADECSFRYSPGPTPSTSRSSGNWVKTAHWLRMMLAIMTSSADPEDGLELTNYISGGDNYSFLPPGYGLGLPASLIDWDSFNEAIARTLDFEFKNFVYGDEPEPFGDLIDRHFLKPIGAYLITDNGAAKVVIPTIPTQGSVSVTLGPSEILTREVGPRQHLPRIRERYNLDFQTGSVVYLPGPNAEPPVRFNAGDFEGVFGPSSYHASDDKPITIPVPGAESAAPWLGKAGATRIFRWHRPALELEAHVDTSRMDFGPGTKFDVSVAELPNLKEATRAWTNVLAEILEREPNLSLDKISARLRLIGWPDVRVGKVCPVGYVEGVSTNDAAITSSRYTKSDAPAPLPTTDAAAFSVGDVVKISNLDGTDADSGTETVDSIVGDVLTLSGNFSGNLAAGQVIRYADAADAATQQLAAFIHFASTSNNLIGGTTREPWAYGER